MIKHNTNSQAIRRRSERVAKKESLEVYKARQRNSIAEIPSRKVETSDSKDDLNKQAQQKSDLKTNETETRALKKQGKSRSLSPKKLTKKVVKAKFAMESHQVRRKSSRLAKTLKQSTEHSNQNNSPNREQKLVQDKVEKRVRIEAREQESQQEKAQETVAETELKPEPNAKTDTEVEQEIKQEPSNEVALETVQKREREQGQDPEQYTEQAPVQDTEKEQYKGQFLTRTSAIFPPSTPSPEKNQELSPKKRVSFTPSIVTTRSSFSESRGSSPLKSILKPEKGPSEKGDPHANAPIHLHGNATCLHPGEILQGVPVEEKLQRCLNLLQDGDCPRKYEIYASLSSLLSVPELVGRLNYFPRVSNWIRLVAYLYRDIITSAKKDRSDNDPFNNRVIIQGFKVLTSICSKFEIVSSLPEKQISEFVEFIIDQLSNNKNLPKSVTASFQQFIKVQKLVLFQKLDTDAQKQHYATLLSANKLPHEAQKRMLLSYCRKIFVPLSLSEKLLVAVVSGKDFESNSTLIDKASILNNFAIQSPKVIYKCFRPCMKFLFRNLVSLQFGNNFKDRVLNNTVSTFLELAKTFLDDSSFKLKFFLFISRSIVTVDSVGSYIFSLDTTIQEDNIAEIEVSDTSQLMQVQSNQSVFKLVLVSLSKLVKQKYYNQVMDIWLAITLLLNYDAGPGYKAFDIISWSSLSEWLSIYDLCEQSSKAGCIVAYKSWKCIIFNCHRQIRNQTGFENHQKASNILSYFQLVTRPLRQCSTASISSESLQILVAQVFYKIKYLMFNKIKFNDDVYDMVWHELTPFFKMICHNESISKKFITEFIMSNTDEHAIDAKSTKRNLDNANTRFVPYLLLSNRLEPSTVAPIPQHWIIKRYSAFLKFIDELIDSKVTLSNCLDVTNQTIALFKQYYTKCSNESKEQFKDDFCQTLRKLCTETAKSEDPLIYKRCTVLLAEFLAFFQINALRSHNLEFIKDFIGNSKEPCKTLQLLLNSLPLSKQLIVFKIVASIQDDSVIQFMKNNIESRDFRNFTYNDFKIIGDLIVTIDSKLFRHNMIKAIANYIESLSNQSQNMKQHQKIQELLNALQLSSLKEADDYIILGKCLTHNRTSSKILLDKISTMKESSVKFLLQLITREDEDQQVGWDLCLNDNLWLHALNGNVEENESKIFLEKLSDKVGAQEIRMLLIDKIKSETSNASLQIWLNGTAKETSTESTSNSIKCKILPTNDLSGIHAQAKPNMIETMDRLGDKEVKLTEIRNTQSGEDLIEFVASESSADEDNDDLSDPDISSDIGSDIASDNETCPQKPNGKSLPKAVRVKVENNFIGARNNSKGENSARDGDQGKYSDEDSNDDNFMDASDVLEPAKDEKIPGTKQNERKRKIPQAEQQITEKLPSVSASKKRKVHTGIGGYLGSKSNGSRSGSVGYEQIASKLSCITEESLQSLSAEEKYALETTLLKIMMKLREE